jgi:hypothetical protein
MTEIEVNIPERVMDEIADNLVILTREIDRRDPEKTAHGFLGGEHGYGAHWDNAVFTMRPYYWGDCTCGHDEREAAWDAANKHRDDCYQSELRGIMAEYDRDSGYAEINRAAFGGDESVMGGMDTQEESPMPGVMVMTMTPRRDKVMDEWRRAHDKRRKFEDEVYAKLCAKHRLSRYGCAVHCTCDYQPNWQAWVKVNGHRDDCELVLPNFRHKASGMAVRWYKYIGRDMGATGAPEDINALVAIFRECIASLPAP